MIKKQKNSEPEKKTYSAEEAEALIKERLAKEKKQWEKGSDEKIADERIRAKRLAALPEDERKKFEFDESVKAFENEKKRYMRDKLEFEAAKILADEKLPPAFAKILSGETLDETIENINTFKAEFLKEVETNLNSRLRGKTPMTSSVVENSDPFLMGFGN